MPLRSLGRVTGLGAAIGLLMAGHSFTPLEMTLLHNVYQRLYYLPILLAAFWFGVPGALAVSGLSAVTYLPHILMDWSGSPAYSEAQYAELLMFQAVALAVGMLAQHEKRERQKREKTARELAEAYQKLQESFEHLRRADRLSALGQLSAGLAHEIKNPLASMKGSLDILASDFPPGHSKREFLEILQREVDRLNKVLTEFLQFARAPQPDRQPCSLREVLDSIHLLCAKEANRRGVRLEVECPPDLPEIYADSGQLQQALLNIVLNGIEAMPGGGRLGVRVLRSGRGIEVRVHDEGTGIPAENRSRIFDPFFTTKERGTGLGLAIADKLVQGHGGEIRVEGDARAGTTFVVALPMETSPV